MKIDGVKKEMPEKEYLSLPHTDEFIKLLEDIALGGIYNNQTRERISEKKYRSLEDKTVKNMRSMGKDRSRIASIVEYEFEENNGIKTIQTQVILTY